jgi:hypothetical protein
MAEDTSSGSFDVVLIPARRDSDSLRIVQVNRFEEVNIMAVSIPSVHSAKGQSKLMRVLPFLAMQDAARRLGPGDAAPGQAIKRTPCSGIVDQTFSGSLHSAP